MPQLQLPFFPAGVTEITPLLAFGVDEGRVTYFHHTRPVLVHAQADVASFRLITAPFCVNGNAQQSEIARAFGIPKVPVKRAVKGYREVGPKGVYQPRQTRGAAVLSSAVLAAARQLLDAGLATSAVADRLGIKRDTLAKAVRAGRWSVRGKNKTLPPR
jgi:transposase-like protein